MSRRVRAIGLRCFPVIVTLVFLASCSDDDSPTDPGHAATGTVILDPSPVSLSAPWTLSGPAGYNESGAGTRHVNGAATGDYSVTWGDVPDHVTPPVWLERLVGGETATFRTIYPRLRSLPAGSFTMGSPPSELGRGADEATHEVVLTNPIAVLENEVTNRHYAELAQWAFNNALCAVVNGSVRDATDFSSDRFLDLNQATSEISFTDFRFVVDPGKEDHPVKHVTWHGAAAFCNWLSLQAGLAPAYDQDSWDCNGGDPYGATGYRLPTEAEWEYACRSGSASAFANGEITETECGDPVLALIGWHCGDATDATHPVGQLMANDWDLFDMHGNVFEWCHDLYGPYAGDQTDPTGSPTGLNRVMRGGAWNTNASYCRSASRADFAPFQSAPAIGFRPVRSVGR